MDLGNPDQLRAVIRAVKPTLIINPAAYTAVDLAESEPDLAMRVNGDAPGIMAEEAKRLGAAMIHYSTDYVFDGTKGGAYTEDDLPCPVNVYGKTKLAGEQAIQAAGIPHLILRTSWVYGMHGKNFLLTILRLAKERSELQIVADQHGSPTWSRTIADSAAKILSQMGDARAWEECSGIYHMTAQGQTTWHGFAQAILENPSVALPTPVIPIPAEAYPLPARRPANSVLSSNRFISTFCALPAWDVALKSCLK